MMQLRLDDTGTLEAIRILSDVLDDMAGPEKLECLMAANALRQVLETKSETAMNFARQAFESLDPSIRVQIRSDATEVAVKLMEERTRLPKPSQTRLSRTPAKPTGATVLDAINSGGMRTERKW